MRSVLKIAGVVLGMALSSAAMANDWDESGFFASNDTVGGFASKTSLAYDSTNGNKWSTTSFTTDFIKGCSRGQESSSGKCADPRFTLEATPAEDDGEPFVVSDDCGLYTSKNCETAYSAARVGNFATGFAAFSEGVLRGNAYATRKEALLVAPGFCGLSAAGTGVCDGNNQVTNCGLAPANSNCRALYLNFCSDPQRTCDI